MKMRRIAALATSLFLILLVSPASAHTVLVSSTPQANSVIESIPSSISITFAEDLVEIGNSNSISVLDQDGDEVSQGNVSVSGPTLSKNLIAGDQTGIFKVDYRAVAADGHVIQDSYTFTVTPTAVTTSAIQDDPVSSSPVESEKKVSIYFILSVTAIVGGLLILIFIWKKQAK
jgi:methionine-rich copper-binding protein CopC